MLRIYACLALLSILLGGGLAFADWPDAGSVASRNDDRLMQAYTQVQPGMPFSRLGALGFDLARAERLSKLALMERYMPKDSQAFDALDPAVRNCYLGPGDCTAYIFEGYGQQTVLLVQGGRVTWKMMSDSALARSDVVSGTRLARAE